MKKKLFGYSIKDVNQRIDDYEALLDLQRRDIEYLKRDNAMLKNAISKMNLDGE